MDRRWLRRCLAGPTELLAHRRLRWLGPHLRHPRLWHLGRRTVALGTAIGICFGILVPVGQIPLAVVVAIACRANLPTAVLGTFVTNGVTYVPVYALAYWVGCAITGAEAFPQLLDSSSAGAIGAAAASMWNAPRSWSTFGLPLVVGVVALAGIAATSAYLFVLGSWSLRVRRAWLRRRPRAAA